jgi:MFS family permease
MNSTARVTNPPNRSDSTTTSMELDDLIDNEEEEYESPLASQREGLSNKYLKKSSFRSRWLVLVLCCILMSANYYAWVYCVYLIVLHLWLLYAHKSRVMSNRYDIPSALHQQIQTYMPPSSNFETNFNLLYTAYSIPNTILPLFGGNVVDRYGAPYCQTIFAMAVFVGSFVLCIGVNNQSWEIMYFGRFIFGLGAESLSVAQSTVLSEWFEGREVALAMGMALSVSRLGSIWNNLISPKVANSKNGGVDAAFALGAILTSMSVVMGGCIVLVDKRARRKIEKRTRDEIESLTAALLEGSIVESEFIRTGGSSRNCNALGEEAEVEDDVESDTVHLSEIRKFRPLFWLLSLSCVVVYGCVLPFNNVSSGILLERNFFTSPPDCHLAYEYQCADGCKYWRYSSTFMLAPCNSHMYYLSSYS